MEERKLIMNQSQYDELVNSHIELYWNKFQNEKADAIDIKTFYIKSDNTLNARLNYLQSNFKIGEASYFINDWIYHNNSKSKIDSLFEILRIYATKNNVDLYDLAESKAEFEAIQSVFERIRLESIAKPDEVEKAVELNSIFNTNSNFSKIDYIRIINALYEIKAITKMDGTIPTKRDVMIEFGKIVGLDLSSYEKDLSKAVNISDLNINTRIFETLKTTMSDYCNKLLANKENI